MAPAAYEGHNTFNVSELLGPRHRPGHFAELLPQPDPYCKRHYAKYAYAIGRDALTNVFREF